LSVSQRLTAIYVIDETGRKLWRGQCVTDPEQIERTVRGMRERMPGLRLETGPMTSWLEHELRARGLNVTCFDARHGSAALKMQMSKTDQNDAEGLAQIMRMGVAGLKDPPAQQVEPLGQRRAGTSHQKSCRAEMLARRKAALDPA